jgi:hypothetical protein
MISFGNFSRNLINEDFEVDELILIIKQESCLDNL